MSTKAIVEIAMVRICRTLSVWWVALAVGCAAAVAGPADDFLRAAFRGDTAAVRALLAKGANVNTKSSNGWTALMLASAFGRLDMVQALLAKGADVNAKNSDDESALDMAENNDVRALLVQAGAKP